PLVQRLPSEHEPPCGTGDEQVPVLGWQVPGSLHWSPLAQTTGLPTQVPFWQVSPVVQRVLSGHEPPCGTRGEQVAGLGWAVRGSLHWSPLVQPAGLPSPARRCSDPPLVQRLPSEHEPPCGTGGEQVPVLGWQVPGSLHWSPLAQTTGLPTQVPFWQVSP